MSPATPTDEDTYAICYCTARYVLVASSSMRSNPTTVLITFLTASNLVFTSLVLPQTAVSMLNVGYVLVPQAFKYNVNTIFDKV